MLLSGSSDSDSPPGGRSTSLLPSTVQRGDGSFRTTNSLLISGRAYGPPPPPLQSPNIEPPLPQNGAYTEAHPHPPHQNYPLHLDSNSDLGENYEYTTEESNSGQRRTGRPSSPMGSVYSFHSSVDSHLFRDLHGRKFNTLNTAYHLPADMEEHERLNIQHRVITLLLGNLYPAEDIVESLLQPKDNYTPMILDIGAGSGAWAIEMANKFPHCEVIGVDLVPPNLGNREIPPNCRFEVDDANLSLTHWTNTFELVHCRAIEVGISDWEAFSYNVAQILKPGGLFLSGTGNTQFLNDRCEPYQVITEGEPGFRWIQKWFSAVHEAFVKQRGSEWPLHQWHDIAERNPNYKDVTSKQLHMPVGNWLPDGSRSDHQYAAELLRYNFIQIFKSFKPLLISRGYPEAIVDRWRIETVKELIGLRVRTLAAFSWTWCRRTEAPWVPIPGPNRAQG
ncbi:hypothetical protein FRC03_009372 [Tulasnella sp. 419]|nr:hypothetical protein FRC03_009372 [Tulasnella sp. 419]